MIKINPKEKLPTKVGLSELEKKMTYAQALRYGRSNMPPDLNRAGFECIIFRSDRIIHGSDFYRINYGR